MTSPLISIIVPIYNSELFLERCLESIIRQTYERFEVILVNDGSTDQSLKICDDYLARFANFKLLQQENAGLSAARNAGMDIALGTYILFVDSDDRIEKNLLEKQVLNIQNQEVDLVIFGYFYDMYDSQGRVHSTVKSAPTQTISDAKTIVSSCIAMKESALIDPAWNKLFKTSIIRKLNVQFPVHELYEDTDFIFRYLDGVQSIYIDEACFYHYIQRDVQRITNTYNPEKFQFLKKRVEVMIDYMNRHDDDPSQDLVSRANFWIIRYSFSCLSDLYAKKLNMRHLQKIQRTKAIINDPEAQTMADLVYSIKGFKNNLLLFAYRLGNITIILWIAHLMSLIKTNAKALFGRIR